jgi:hypothetical protein
VVTLTGCYIYNNLDIGFFPTWKQRFLVLLSVDTNTGLIPDSILCLYWALSPRVEWPEFETDHTPPSEAEDSALFCTSASLSFHCL